MYTILYSPRAFKSFKKIPRNYQQRIKNKINELSKNPYIPGTLKLVNYPVAKLRHRVGRYRILFDIDEEEKIIEILDIRKREEKTYK